MDNDKFIWDYLYGKIGNPYGVAALMGNLYIESKLQSAYLQSSYARKLGMTSAEYTESVDNGSYVNFINDKAGYGLAQWTYWSRKEALLDFAKESRASIGDLKMQLDYLWFELQKYTTVIETMQVAKSVREASDVIAKKYERPKDQSETALKRRSDYGEVYYRQFADKPKKKVKYVIATANVNIRVGNGKEYAKVGTLVKNHSLRYVATSDNGWFAVVNGTQVCWVSGEFAQVIEKEE